VSQRSICRRHRAEPRDARGISFLARHWRRRGRDVNGSGSYRRGALWTAHSGVVSRHRYVLARCSGAGGAGGNPDDGRAGREKAAGPGAARGGGAVKGTWAVLVFAMVWPTVAALGYFVGLASKEGADAGANIAFLTVYYGSKIVPFSLPVLWLGIWQGQKLRPSVPHFSGLRLGLAFGLLVAGAMLALYFGELQHSTL